MRLDRLRVQGWKGLAGVDFTLGPGLNLICGPNESGKTSLRDAIRSVFLDAPSKRAKGGPIAARPWGTSENPLVEIHFQFAGAACELTKRFLAQKGSFLRVDGKVVAQDATLQDQLNSLLPLENLSVLWAVQGDAELPLVPIALRSELATLEAVTPGVSWLESQLVEACEKFWSPERGSARKPLKDAREATSTRERQAGELEDELAECDRLSAQIQHLGGDLVDLEARGAELQTRLDRDQESLGAWDLYEREVQTCNALEQERKALESWQAGWARNVATLRELEGARESYSRRLTELRERMGPPPTRGRVEELRAAQARQRGLVRSLLTRELERLGAPSKEELDRLAKLERSIAGQEAALESGAASVVLTAEVALSPRAVVDDERLDVDLPSGESQRYRVRNALTLELPGVARIQVESGNPGDKWEALTALKGERARLEGVLRVKSFQEAEERFDRSRELSARLAGYSDAEPVEPGAGDGLEALERELASIPAQLEQAEREFAEADKRQRALQGELETLLRDDPESRWKTVHELLLSQAAERADLDLKEPFPEKPLESAIARLTQELERKKAALVAPSGSPVTREGMASLRTSVEAMRSDRERTAAEMQQKIGAVARFKGAYEKLAEAQEAWGKAFQEERKVELEAQAVKLLREALKQAKAELQDDLVGPLQERLGARLGELTSARYQGVVLKQDFQVATVVPAYVNHRPEVAELSFGTREQLTFLARVCLAELLSEKGEPQALLLDDSLVHTDQERMERACALLREVAGKLQVIVFTCHPERFESIRGDCSVHEL